MSEQAEQPWRPTAKDVAAFAGLSRSTVSQILNGHGDRFHAETQQRVAQAAAELNYRPSRAGRALLTGLSEMVIVVVPNATFGRHLQDAVDRIAGVTSIHGKSVVVRYSGDDPAATLTAVLDLRPAVVVDLGVFSSSERRRIAAAGTTIYPELTAESGVEQPSEMVGRLQVSHLLRHGHRRVVIALLADERSDPYGPSRVAGATAECLSRGLPPPDVVSIPLRREGAREALEPLLRESDEPVAVCCYNDDVGLAVLAVAHDLGFAVPEQISVIGVDNSEVGQLVEHPLSTISVDMPSIVASFFAEVPSDNRFDRFVTIVPGATT
ncbi:LacI family DNA-binding transcriptional regulator [Microterricola viridarii]|uniref:LacI family DNA-binding transcriptional regulator n=1 Tax=Microterricola viridarii TaxID=412690 RepID=UPI0015603FEE|nr:LacI family DNA-binding transcriptional regulator [Microterricola viridarii]